MNERNEERIIVKKAIKELAEVYGITGEKYENCNTWHDLSRMPLPENFIEKHTDDVEWNWISAYQKLSETFIEKHVVKINWISISCCQKLSENFIEKHVDDVNWISIYICQKLSEGFIEKYADKVDWDCYEIATYQKLSENFIRKYKNKLNLHDIARHQVISLKFARELGVADVFLRHNNCLKPVSYWKKAVKNTGLYECHKDYFYAYKGIRSDRYSCRNFQYQYLPGGTYGCFSDYSDDENSFGLSAWTKEKATNYCDELVIKVKIYYKDVTAVVHDGGKIRCKKMTVLN